MVAEEEVETHNDRADESKAATHVDRPYLIVALECDRPLAGAARFCLEGVDRVLIGRGTERKCERRLEGGLVTLDVRVPGRSMSASHARLVRTGMEWAIDDLGSTNGIFLNGKSIQRGVLDQDDVLEVGHTVMLLRSARTALAMTDVDTARCPPKATPMTMNAALSDRFATLERVAGSAVSVLLLGESGTGKEVAARALHAASGRSGEFVAVNCGAVPDSLVESQLFGHSRGAFSGAVRDELGYIRSASGGTLFLDEIADLPHVSQAALLRVLQEREVVPVGSTRGVKVDFRLVAATHQPLAKLVARGSFRHDLFARIAGYLVTILPLRDRKEDLGVLVADLVRRIAGHRAPSVTLTPAAGRALFAYSWPFNIRELEQCLTSALASTSNLQIDVSHLGANVREEESGNLVALDLEPCGDDPVRLRLLEQLAMHHGHVPSVARAMGKARMQVHRWLKRYGIDPKSYRQ